jgi:hypothetical protein
VGYGRNVLFWQLECKKFLAREFLKRLISCKIQVLNFRPQKELRLDHRIYQRIMRTERIILKLRLKAKDVRRETDLLMMIHIPEGRSLNA